MTHGSGAKYDGYFKDGKKNGMGRWVFNNGEVLLGLWKNNEIVIGAEKTNSGEIYNGEWKHDRRHGKGIIKYKQGS